MILCSLRLYETFTFTSLLLAQCSERLRVRRFRDVESAVFRAVTRSSARFHTGRNRAVTALED